MQRDMDAVKEAVKVIRAAVRRKIRGDWTDCCLRDMRRPEDELDARARCNHGLVFKFAFKFGNSKEQQKECVLAMAHCAESAKRAVGESLLEAVMSKNSPFGKIVEIIADCDVAFEYETEKIAGFVDFSIIYEKSVGEFWKEVDAGTIKIPNKAS